MNNKITSRHQPINTIVEKVSFILKKVKGQFVVAYIGAIDDNSNEPELVKHAYVENALNALLKGEEVKPSFTKAVGCGIKWKQ